MIPAVPAQSEPAIDPVAVERFTKVALHGLAGFVDVRLLAEKGTPEPAAAMLLPPGQRSVWPRRSSGAPTRRSLPAAPATWSPPRRRSGGGLEPRP